RAQLEVARAGARGQRGVGGARLRRAIEGADLLADVAAEDPAPDRRPQRARDGAAQLDGEVGDAAARVERVGVDEGARGAGVEAGAAAAAAGGGARAARR